MRKFRYSVLVFVCIAGILSGCANARPYRGMDLSSASMTYLVRGSPMVAQTSEYSCGYACLASVAIYHGVATEKVASQIRLSASQNPRLSAGTMVALAESLELVAFAYIGSVEDLRTNLRKNRPIIVLLQAAPKVGTYPSFAWALETGKSLNSSPHWVVVLGMEPDGSVVFSDPNKGLLKMKGDSFYKQWDSQNRRAVLVGRKSGSSSESI